jgi:hypothetical protein
LQQLTYAAGACGDQRFVPRCDSTSFTRPRTVPTGNAPFTMIIASDTQLPWGTDPGCTGTTSECELEYGILTNQWFARSMNNIQSLGTWPAVLPNAGGSAVEQPVGVIINGDLTAFFHLARSLLVNLRSVVPGTDPECSAPLSAGSVDYANNVNDRFGNGRSIDAHGATPAVHNRYTRWYAGGSNLHRGSQLR